MNYIIINMIEIMSTLLFSMQIIRHTFIWFYIIYNSNSNHKFYENYHTHLEEYMRKSTVSAIYIFCNASWVYACGRVHVFW